MGELWYNWEMYASNPVGIGVAKLGWYWAGNPNLKPEKSVNFDMSLEGENKNTYARVGVFQQPHQELYVCILHRGLYGLCTIPQRRCEVPTGPRYDLQL